LSTIQIVLLVSPIVDQHAHLVIRFL